MQSRASTSASIAKSQVEAVAEAMAETKSQVVAVAEALVALVAALRILTLVASCAKVFCMLCHQSRNIPLITL